MTARTRSLRLRRPGRADPEPEAARVTPEVLEPASSPVDIPPGDPLLGHLLQASGAVDLDELELDSPAVRDLRAAGVRLVVPLVSQGELIGALNLGPRRSEQDYSSDDRRLLDGLAAQAAPALRVGQLIREQAAEAVTRERFEQELEVARLIQQNFLPRELPQPDGWEVAATYRPAREVGGDFYDVIALPDGRLGFVLGDVTDKGVPAALVMSATRSVLRSVATRLLEPGAVLEEVNRQLCPDMPPKMFVTCLYLVLDPATGHVRFANAGQDLPKLRTVDGIVELRARGMPLGLVATSAYEEREATIEPGQGVLLHSDGVVEAHGPGREMFGGPRLTSTITDGPAGSALIAHVLDTLDAFTGPGHEQEDDITMVTFTRGDGGEVLTEFELASAPGNEREAMARVTAAIASFGLDESTLNRLGTAVGEGTMNAMEHGNRYAPDQPVCIRVLRDADRLRIQVADCGEVEDVPAPEAPDLGAKLEGRQSPRGWGLFLIEQMVDDARVFLQDGRRTLELVVELPHA